MLHNSLTDVLFHVRIFFVLACIATTISSSCAHHGSRRVSKDKHILAMMSKAQTLYGQGEYEAAIAVLQNSMQSMDSSPVHAESLELLITWLLQLNRRQEAQRLVEDLVAHDLSHELLQKLMSLINDDQQLATLEEDKSLRDYEDEPTDAVPVWSE